MKQKIGAVETIIIRLCVYSSADTKVLQLYTALQKVSVYIIAIKFILRLKAAFTRMLELSLKHE